MAEPRTNGDNESFFRLTLITQVSQKLGGKSYAFKTMPPRKDEKLTEVDLEIRLRVYATKSGGLGVRKTTTLKTIAAEGPTPKTRHSLQSPGGVGNAERTENHPADCGGIGGSSHAGLGMEKNALGWSWSGLAEKLGGCGVRSLSGSARGCILRSES